MNKLRLATKKLMKVARYFFGYDHSIYFKNESNLSMDSPTDKTKLLMVKPYEYIVEQICFLFAFQLICSKSCPMYSRM